MVPGGPPRESPGEPGGGGFGEGPGLGGRPAPAPGGIPGRTPKLYQNARNLRKLQVSLNSRKKRVPISIVLWSKREVQNAIKTGSF